MAGGDGKMLLEVESCVQGNHSWGKLLRVGYGAGQTGVFQCSFALVCPARSEQGRAIKDNELCYREGRKLTYCSQGQTNCQDAEEYQCCYLEPFDRHFYPPII